MITKEKLLERKAKAEQEKLQLIAHMGAVSQIIAECDAWLEEIDKPEEPASPTDPKNPS